VQLGVLRFGSFTLSPGAKVPIFSMPDYSTPAPRSARWGALRAAVADRLEFDMLFGPPTKASSGDHYRGGPFGTVRAIRLCLHRKEAKDHGEGWQDRGAAAGRVLIVDDVITAGTAIRESIDIHPGAGPRLRGCCLRWIARNAVRQ